MDHNYGLLPPHLPTRITRRDPRAERGITAEVSYSFPPPSNINCGSRQTKDLSLNAPFRNGGAGLDNIFRRLATGNDVAEEPRQMGRGGTDHNLASLGHPRLVQASSHSDKTGVDYSSQIERERRDPADSGDIETPSVKTEGQQFLPSKGAKTNSGDRTTLNLSQTRTESSIEKNNLIPKFGCPTGEDYEEKIVPRRNLMTAFETCGGRDRENRCVQREQNLDQAPGTERNGIEVVSPSEASLTPCPAKVTAANSTQQEILKGVSKLSPTGVDELDGKQETSQITSQDGKPDTNKISAKGINLQGAGTSQPPGSQCAEGLASSMMSSPVVEETGKPTAQNPTSKTPSARAESPFKWDDVEKNGRLELPLFNLHSSLKRELSQGLVNRVSFYGIIHDINKEANAMAANDQASFHRSGSSIEGADTVPPKDEENCPLVVAVNGHPPSRSLSQDEKVLPGGAMAFAAVIDEERWLLWAIASRSSDEIADRACPPSFAEAIGEQEAGEGPEGSSNREPNGQTANPLSALASSRTQLWKPSRSWWEAKSGKNPWIEPASHNKRWRYLWPLIHYHKFLARCIKKLKRNGVDVKTSVSPVSAFLREEVCAVSDHLAAVSKFTAEEWMGALEHFKGWTDDDPDAQEELGEIVSRQKLRSLAEPCDVDSPLLRDQIAEQFLRAMAASRELMANGGQHVSKGVSGKVGFGSTEGSKNHPKPGHSSHMSVGGSAPYSAYSSSFPYHNGGYGPSFAASGHHKQLPSDRSPLHDMIRQRLNRRGGRLGSKPRRGYQFRHRDAWVPHPNYYANDPTYAHMYSSHHYSHAHGHYSMYSDPAGHFFPPSHHGTTIAASVPQDYYHESYQMNSSFPVPSSYQLEPPSPGAWQQPDKPQYGSSDPLPDDAGGEGEAETTGDDQDVRNNDKTGPAKKHQSAEGQSQAETEESPKKYPDHSQIPPSPFWGHVEQATLAMTGLATPQNHLTPGGMRARTKQGEEKQDSPPKGAAFVRNMPNAQPLLINPSAQYYHRQYGARGGYAPPSPATQFLMSPQANSQAAAYLSQNSFAHHRGGAMAPYSPFTVDELSEAHGLPVHDNISFARPRDTGAGPEAHKQKTDTTATPAQGPRKSKGTEQVSPAQK